MTVDVQEDVVITSAMITRRMFVARRVGVVFASMLLIFGFIVGFDAMENARMLTSEGVETSAVVSDMKVERRIKKGGRIARDHIIHYHFADQYGNRRSYEFETAPELYESFHVGSEFTVRYMLAEPHNHERAAVIDRQLSLFGVFQRAFIGFVIALLVFEGIRFAVGAKLRKVMAQQTV